MTLIFIYGAGGVDDDDDGDDDDAGEVALPDDKIKGHHPSSPHMVALVGAEGAKRLLR